MIDAHHHLWDPAARRYPWMDGPRMDRIRRRYDLADLRTVTRAAGVEHTVLVQTVSDVAETAEYLAVAAASSGLIAGVVGWVDLTAASVADDVVALAAGVGGERLVGIRHQAEDEASPEWLLRGDVSRGLDTVGQAGLVYDLLVHADGLATCATVADRHPDMRFVLDHAGKPPIADGDLSRWRADLSALARRPNVFAKLSGLVTEADWRTWTVTDLAPVAEHLLGEFGPDRVMFGSDWPVCELAASYQQVAQVAADILRVLSDDERTDVCDRTAARVYGLSVS